MAIYHGLQVALVKQCTLDWSSFVLGFGECMPFPLIRSAIFGPSTEQRGVFSLPPHPQTPPPSTSPFITHLAGYYQPSKSAVIGSNLVSLPYSLCCWILQTRQFQQGILHNENIIGDVIWYDMIWLIWYGTIPKWLLFHNTHNPLCFMLFSFEL